MKKIIDNSKIYGLYVQIVNECDQARKDVKTMMAHYDRAHELMSEMDKVAKKLGTFVGRWVRFQVADGYAWYVVVRENKHSFQLKHIDLDDGYQYEALKSGGSYKKSDISDRILARDLLKIS